MSHPLRLIFYFIGKLCLVLMDCLGPCLFFVQETEDNAG